MTMESLAAQLCEAQTRLDRLVGERDALSRKGQKITDGERERLKNLVAGIRTAEAEVESLAEQHERLSRFARTPAPATERVVEFPRDVMAEYRQWAGYDQPSRGNGLQVITGADPFTDDATSGTPAQLRSRALTAAERVEHLGDDKVRAELTRWIERAETSDDLSAISKWAIVAGDPAYASAFAKVAVDRLGPTDFTNAERAAWQRARALTRTMVAGTDASGGSLTPVAIDSSIHLNNAGEISPLRQIARTVTIGTTQFRAVDSAGVEASFDAEEAEASDDSITDLNETVITPERLTAAVEYSYELAMDYRDLLGELSRVTMDAFAVAEGEKFWSGAGHGSTEPNGVITVLTASTSTEVSCTTDGTFSIGDVYKFLEAVPARFRRNTSWVGSLEIINQCRRFGEGTTGSNSAFIADLGDGTPPRMLGKPVYEATSSAFGTSVASNNVDDLFVVGDFNAGCTIVDRIGAVTRFIDAVGGNQRPKGTQFAFTIKRTSCDLHNSNSLRLAQNGSS